jgi:hypothetical protein
VTIGQIAAVLLQADRNDFAALGGFLAVIITLASIVGGLVGGLIVKPMITNAKDEILKGTVSKELFELYVSTDTREHGEIKDQLNAIAARNHR